MNFKGFNGKDINTYSFYKENEQINKKKKGSLFWTTRATTAYKLSLSKLEKLTHCF